MTEEWRKYLDTNYEFSNLGRARGPLGIMKPYPNTSGYLQVGIYDGHKNRVKKFLSFCVATAWLDNPNGYQYVHHKDENPLNNRPDNLEWVANRSHPGKRSPKRRMLNRERRGKDIAQVDAETGDIIRVWNREKLKRETAYHFPYILRCCENGHRHRGYKWRYFSRNYQTRLAL